MSHDKPTPLNAPRAPRLPGLEGPDDASKFSSALRTYFQQVDGTLGTLAGPQGARFLDFPRIKSASLANQTAADTSTGYAVAFATTAEAVGLTLDATTSTKLTADHPGLYKLAYLLQFNNINAAAQTVTLWLTRDGVIEENSGSIFTVAPGKSKVNLDTTVEMRVDEELVLMWHTTSTDVSLSYTAAQTTPTRPASPSASLDGQFISAISIETKNAFVPPAPPPPITTPPTNSVVLVGKRLTVGRGTVPASSSIGLTGGQITARSGGVTPGQAGNITLSSHVLTVQRGTVSLSAPVPPPPPPPPAGPPTIETLSRHPYDWLQMGSPTYAYFVEDNRWGQSGIVEGSASYEFRQQIGRSLTVGANGEVACRFSWYWPQFTQDGTYIQSVPGTSEVKAYPAIIYGGKPGYSGTDRSGVVTAYPAKEYAVRLPDGAAPASPPADAPSTVVNNWIPAGGSVSTATPSGYSPGTVLPVQLPFSGTLKASFKWQHNTTVTGVGQLTFDLWLKETSPQNHGFIWSSITHEIMVPITNWGTYGNHYPNGGDWARAQGSYSHDAVIGDMVYAVYRRPYPTTGYTFADGGLNGTYTNEETGSGRTGWKFIVFMPKTFPHPTDANGYVNVDFAGILEHLRTDSRCVDDRGIRWIRGIEYVSSIELGIEPVYGGGDVTVYEYKIAATAPAPAPPPPPPPPAPSGGERVLATYWPAWDTTYSITALPAEFTHVYLFHMTPDGPSVDVNNNGKGTSTAGRFEFKWPGRLANGEVQTVRGRGQKVIVTMGGQNNGYNFEFRSESDNFLASFYEFSDAYGPFDGLDVNCYEADVISLSGPTSLWNTFTDEMIYISQQLKARYGPGFLITTPSAPNYLRDLHICQRWNDSGYFDWAAPQYYDWDGFADRGFISGLSGTGTHSGVNRNADWVDRSNIIAGGAMRGDESKVMLGLPSNYPSGVNLTLQGCIDEWNECVRVYPNMRGVFGWNMLYNNNGGNVWGKGMYDALRLSPSGAAVTLTGKHLAAARGALSPTTPGNVTLSSAAISVARGILVATSSGSAPFVPFGSRPDGVYPYGIRPNNVTNTQMDNTIRTHYTSWRNALLKKSPTFTAHSLSIYGAVSITDGYHVQFPGAGTVSEGIGYGMLIVVIMAGYEPNARTYFDGMYRVARARPAYGQINAGQTVNGQYLMEWKLGTDMGSLGEGWNALDGDLDIALALLMADRQWGSGGSINYRQEAINTITAMKAINFSSLGHPQGPQSQRYASRTSDYMPGLFRSFKAATGDTFWDTARTRCASLLNTVITSHSASAKLVPDFIIDTNPSPPAGYVGGTTPIPSTGNIVEGSYEGRYAYNAQRDPWRWGSDFIWSNDSTWGAFSHDIVTTIKGLCSSNPNLLVETYNLNGTAFGTNQYFVKEQAAGLMVGCMANSAHQSFLNTLWTSHANNFATNYFTSELQLLAMITASGNWWRPT